jgi:hypothetical protein
MQQHPYRQLAFVKELENAIDDEGRSAITVSTTQRASIALGSTRIFNGSVRDSKNPRALAAIECR